MSHKPSGLWCDLCGKPILRGEWWHIRVQGTEGHACAKCEETYHKEREREDEKFSEHLNNGRTE